MGANEVSNGIHKEAQDEIHDEIPEGKKDGACN